MIRNIINNPPSQDLNFQHHMSLPLFVLSELWLEVVVLFVLSELWLEVIVLFVLSELWWEVIGFFLCSVSYDWK